MTKATAKTKAAASRKQSQEQEVRQVSAIRGAFNKVAGITAEIAQPTAKAMVKIAPKLAVAGLAGLEALPFVLAAAATGAAISVGLQHISRRQQATAQAKEKAPGF